ncbi:MAG TPA: amidohydrolase family protein [Acidimicrobiia bacterium]|nr:amidohydrolase family protein [Acidimicrobiia bacterium]
MDLPVELGPCSNGEYDPAPLTPVARAARRRARLDCDDNARRTGMSRRRFLRSVCGVATTLLAINACSEASTRDAARRKPGGTFSVPTTAAVDPDAARAALAGEEFVFDVQGHFLEYGGHEDSGSLQGREFWTGFPQQQCGEADPRVCFSVDHFMEEVFLRSDTSMIALSALPIAPEGSPMSAAAMDHARRLADAACHDERILLHAQALPNVGDLQANLDAMSEAVARSPIVCWKVFTNFPDLYDGSGNAWRLDDGDPALARVGDAFLRHAVELGVPTVAAHKGLSTTLGYSSPFASPVDVGPAARAHGDVRFLVYHSGFEADVAEGPFDPTTADRGVNRLLASMQAAGIGPNQNVYAELGTTWWSLLARPDEAAHLLGKLLVHVGEDNVLWGTDAVFYGSPQGQIQALRAFQISEQFQEQFGYPALTDEIKRKILGLNALQLHDVDPVTVPCTFTRDDLEQLRMTIPVSAERRGPRTPSELRAFVARERAEHGV